MISTDLMFYFHFKLHSLLPLWLVNVGNKNYINNQI